MNDKTTTCPICGQTLQTRGRTCSDPLCRDAAQYLCQVRREMRAAAHRRTARAARRQDRRVARAA